MADSGSGMFSFPYRDVQLSYHKIGHGTPFIVLHGGPGYSHEYLFEPLSALVDGDVSLYFLDFAGHGSSQSVENMTLQDMMEQVEALRLHLDLKRVGLIGHSMGGYVAQMYAATYPDRVQPLLLIATSYKSSGSILGIIKHIGWRGRWKFLTTLLKLPFLASRGRLSDLARDYMDAVGDAYVKHPSNRQRVVSAYIASYKKPIKSYWSLLQEFGKTDLTSLLPRIQAPTLILAGDGDILCKDMQQSLCKQIPNARLIWLNSGHDPYVEDRDEFLDQVSQFISANRR